MPRVESHKHSHLSQLSCKSKHGSEAHNLACQIKRRSSNFSRLPSRLALRSVLDAFLTSFLQRGGLQLKAFWFQAKASGISDEWFRAAINSLPRNVWESIVAQVNQSGPTLDTPPSANVPQQQTPTIPGPNVPTATPFVQTTPATQQAAKPSTSTDRRITLSAPGQTSGPYTVQLQYYAEHATKSALTAQAASIRTPPPGNIAPPQKTVATPKQDVPQVQADVRTPKDANKSTLARDILRSLGKMVPKAQEMGGEPTDKVNNHEGDQLPEVNTSQPDAHVVSPKPLAVLPATSFVCANSALEPPAKPNAQDEPQHVASQNSSTAKSVLKEECGQATVIEGPIMIDLTLDDSDDSVDGKGQEPERTFPIQTSAVTSSQPVSPTNTTNHIPLLENLSLEEPRVDIAADGDNADVRMYSPPLSLATEENMESELLYPPLGGAQPVLPSFEPLPREASEHPLDGQLPLFLPSPPVSPTHTEPPGSDLEMINDEGKGKPSLKRRSVDVDEMEIDTELATPPRVRKRPKQQVYVLVPPAPLYVKKAIKKTKERVIGKDIDPDLEGVGEDEECMRAFLASADL